MISEFCTPGKRYLLETDTFICNKFGLAEFFAEHYSTFGLEKCDKVLDVGCGAMPLGIFLAEKYECSVKGIDLNPVACRCAERNIANLGLNNLIEVCNKDFSVFQEKNTKEKYDLIVANPPIDEKVSRDEILKYANNSFNELDDNSYSYLTNSWHSKEGKDLSDYIFEFGQRNLEDSGAVIMVFCTIDCASPEFVYKKAIKRGFRINKVINKYIASERIGAESLGIDNVRAYMVEFRRI